MNEIEASRKGPQMTNAQRLRAPLEQRRTLAGEEHGFMAFANQSLMKPQRLPLSAAHFEAAVEVKDTHQDGGGIRALAYLRNVYKPAIHAIAAPCGPSRNPAWRT